MPWFITSIISDTVVEKFPEYKHMRTRTFGFFDTYNEASSAIRANQGNLHECLYDFLVLEYIESGIHPTVHVTEWYQWNEVKGKWEYIPSPKLPPDRVQVTNWAVG